MKTKPSMRDTIKQFTRPSVLVMLFLGFSAGIPILLIFSSMSLWLREAGIARSAVTFFSWAALGYSFKFVWAPLVDRLPIPYLTNRMGRRRSWILMSQVMIIVAIVGMALTDPAISEGSLTTMAIAAVLLGFSSATQDIGIDAYRIESDVKEMQALLSSTYIAGYRIGMIVAGAGALFLASAFGSTKENYDYSAWMMTYLIMALTMLVGIITTFAMPEPDVKDDAKFTHSSMDYFRFLMLFALVTGCFVSFFAASSDLAKDLKGHLNEIVANKNLANFVIETVRLFSAVAFSAVFAKLILLTGIANRKMVEETYVYPIKDFFQRYGKSVALLLLALVGLYRISDIVLGVISNVFYQDLGYTKDQIATVVKSFGLIMTIVGGFLGGILTVRFGVIKILFWGALLSALTNLLFMLLANMEPQQTMLYLVISADNLSAGLASAAFIAFLSSLTNISFTAVQYAIFSSLMTLFPKILGGYSGSIVDSVGYSQFFMITAIMGIPVLYIVWLAGKKLEISEKQNS